MLKLRRGAVKVYIAPGRRPRRRGLVGGPNALFPLLEKRKAPGCRWLWYRIGTDAWVCSARLRPGRGQPGGRKNPRLGAGRLMPGRYLVTRRRLVVRAGPSPKARPVRTLREGSGLLLRRKVPGPEGPWRQTRLGWLPARELRFVRPSRLVGVRLRSSRSLPVAWINGATAHAYSRPALGRRLRVGGYKAYARVTVHEVVQKGRRRFARVGPDRWVRAERVRTARLRALPSGVGAGEKWIHVRLRDWTLVAYEGRRPVYAALISRGYNTPRGRFRITRKLAIATLRFQTSSGVYEAEAVPWVLYFKPHYAFHAAYWHDGFGDRASHGCVNLSPRDARWLFEWTAPFLDAGWHEVRATSADPGTVVLVE